MMEAFLGIHWAGLSYTLLLPALICLIIVCVRTYLLKNKRAQLLSSFKQHNFLVNYSATKNIVKMTLVCVGLSCLFLAFLQPQWNEKEELVEQEGRDLFIALDISKSMLAQDIQPSRLAFAKQKIRDLVHALSSERVGLILFAGSAFIQCPLTADYNAFNMFLHQIDAQTISGGTTAIDGAIKKALVAFKTAQGRKNKLLVILTDGEDFSSNLSGVKQAAAQEGMHIFTLGIGTAQGAPIPLVDERGHQQGHQLDRNGAVVISRLNEAILSNLAEDSGGVYLHASPNGSEDVRAIVKAVEGYEKEKFEDKKMPKLEEQYHYFVAISFVCFLLDWVV